MNILLDKSKPLPAIAYSYLRFSMEIQGQGNSFDRQTSGAAEWSERTGIPFQDNLQDLGLSAYKNDHVTKGALGAFLSLCRSDEMKRQTELREVFLVVESLDRLSRRRIMKAVAQLQEIVEAGVKVVTLQDGMLYDDAAMNSLQGLVISITIMSRAHEESATKSKRCAKGWKAKRDRIRETGKGLIQSRVPFCFRVNDDGETLEIIPEAAEICRKVFNMVAAGGTYSGTAKALNRQKVPTAGSFCTWKSAKRGIAWTGAGVSRIIQAHWPIGDFVSSFNGDTIKGYFPRIIEDSLWAKARQVAGKVTPWGKGRGKRSGQRGYNIFTNIARCAVTGEGMQCRDSGTYKQLLPASVRFGRRDGASWNLDKFESLFFNTIRLALDVEKSMEADEHELTLTQGKAQEVEARLANLVKAMALDAAFDVPEVKAQMDELREEKTLLLAAEVSIREKIAAGNTITLDPDEPDREKMRQAIKANVKIIHMHNDEKWFKVELFNGITYKVTHHKSGVVEVESDDFKTKETVALHCKGGRQGWEKAHDLTVRRSRHGPLAAS